MLLIGESTTCPNATGTPTQLLGAPPTCFTQYIPGRAGVPETITGAASRSGKSAACERTTADAARALALPLVYACPPQSAVRNASVTKLGLAKPCRPALARKQASPIFTRAVLPMKNPTCVPGASTPVGALTAPVVQATSFS